MTQSGLLLQGCKFLIMIRLVVLVVLLFLFIQYATNMFIYKQTIHKLISPKLSWISNSLQQKLGIGGNDQKVAARFGSGKSLRNVSHVTMEPKTSSLQKSFDTVHGVSASLNASHMLPDCPLVPPKLVGRLKVMTDAPSFEELEKMMMFLQPGGRYKPPECKARHKVALIIPYRDREEHLRIFLHNLHPMLQRQQLDYGIYVVEEAGKTKFNRAMLMNIGYVEALKQYRYDCFIFHDVDLIPEDDRNLYSCPEQPRHMSVAINTMNYRLPYKDLFGGVSALSKKHMQTLNGFSNEFWGWGGEDDDMSNRIRYHGLKISRYSPNIARYTMLKHHKDVPNPERYNKLYKGKYRFKKDGLSNLKYNRLDLVLKKLYTWILVEVKPQS